MALTIAGFLLGGVLGMRFRVVILIPILIGAVVGLSGTGIALDLGIGSTVVMIVLTATALQVGYLVGSLTRSLLGKIGFETRGHRAHQDTGPVTPAPSRSRSLPA